MRAIILSAFGEQALQIGETDSPPLGANDLRIAVRATAVNRADLLQRAGHYPPPPGASPIIGLECAGEVIEIGPSVRGWSLGDRAMALLAGGGYAEEVVVDAGSAMHVPDALSDIEAAAIPEVFLTAYSNIFMWAHAQRGESVLIHGGGSGVGTAATTLCKLAGLRVFVTAGSDEKCELCVRLTGADVCINYKTEDFAEKARGVNIVLDHIGARYLAKDLEALTVGGRVVIIGSMGGEKIATIDVTSLLGKRQQIIGSHLRGRPVAEKAEIVASFIDRFGDDLNAGRVRPVIDSLFDIDHVEDAHRRMEGDHFGKIVIRVL
jgi:putative PIG3 family NAD(P)H quinone oxidoreductase